MTLGLKALSCKWNTNTGSPLNDSENEKKKLQNKKKEGNFEMA